MDPYRGTGHAGSDLQCVGFAGDPTEDRPDEGAFLLLGEPGVKVIGDECELEACLFRTACLLDECVRAVLFCRESNSESGHRYP